MSQKPHRFTLMNRDIRLLRYLFATKGATERQIHRDIFGKVTGQVVRKRIGILKNQGLIDSGSVSLARPTSVYFTSRKALRSRTIYDFDLLRMEARSSNPTHELSLGDIRHKCSSLAGLEHYLTENELQSELWGGKEYRYKDFLRLNSDGFMRIKLGKNTFSGAIEYEQSEKGKSQYEALFSEYYLSPDISFVFYITGSQKILESILRHDKNVRENRKAIIFGSTLDNFLNSNEFISLESSSERILELPLLEKS